MKRALQSFTPVVRPLNYDSLEAPEGCDMQTGNKLFGALPFSTVCVFSHTGKSPWHAQLDKVSYAIGPNNIGVASPVPFRRRWAAWVASNGVRIGRQGGITLPSDNLGAASGLFPTSKPIKLTHAYDNGALLHIAIQPTEAEQIQMKWYTALSGSTASITFAGKSPVLFNLQTMSTGGPSETGVVIYYLKAAAPNSLFARFSQEAFASERVVTAVMRVALVRLISARRLAGSLVLYATDRYGRDVTLSTDEYQTPIARETVRYGVGIDSGIISKILTDADARVDTVRFGVALDSGLLFSGLSESSTIAAETVRFGVALDSGEIF